MGRLKRQLRWLRRTSAGLAVLIALVLALPLARADTADSEPVFLQLDVRVNGYPLNLIAAFTEMPDGRLASPRSELGELGIAVPGGGPPEELIVLDRLSGLSYVYDESSQSIDLELPDAARLAKNLNAMPDRDAIEAKSGTGLVVNYTGYAAASYDMPDSLAAVDGASLSLDARAFSKFGTLQQTGIVGTTTFSDFTALRLDTTLSYSDQERLRTYRLGDVISGGLRWTRPIRMGGAQVQRNFSLRPDLITMPLPLVEGTAAVPSTLDVYIGGLKAYSGNIDPGPFKVGDIPVFTRSGTARMVLTDSTGRAVETESEFFTSPDLLKRNLYDYSVDVGVVRRDFGSESFGYDDEPVGLASLRYGLSDSLTGEAHVEASAGLVDMGIGGLWSARRFGMFSGAVAGSLHGADEGLFLNAGWEGRYGNMSIQASTSRTFGRYFDLAAATELPPPGKEFVGGVPRALDQVSFGYSFPKIKSGVGMSFIHQEKYDGEESYILSGSYSQTFDNSLSFFVSGFSDFGESGDYGGYVGFSMPLGESMSSSAGLSVAKESWSATAEVSRPFGTKTGDYGWRVSHGEGDSRYSAASASYRASMGVAEGHIAQQDDKVLANAALTGSAVVADGGLFLGNRIEDAFAVVDAGAPGVSVQAENRLVGKTGKNGKLLLPNLHAFQKNKIAIDVNDLPLNASISEAEAFVVPREMSGVLVDFGVKQDAAGVVLVLTDAAGEFLSEGLEVTLAGSGETFVMGYDGQVYVTGAAAENTVTVKTGGSQCQASFDYKSDSETQTTIGPLKCI